MAAELKEITLDTVAGGAAPERFQRAWQELLENVQDVNTDPEAKRTITLKVTVAPHQDRDSAGVKLEVTSKLAPPAPVSDLIYMGQKDGALVAIGRDPRQRNMFDPEDDQSTVLPIGERKARGGS